VKEATSVDEGFFRYYFFGIVWRSRPLPWNRPRRLVRFQRPMHHVLGTTIFLRATSFRYRHSSRCGGRRYGYESGEPRTLCFAIGFHVFGPFPSGSTCSAYSCSAYLYKVDLAFLELRLVWRLRCLTSIWMRAWSAVQIPDYKTFK